MHLMRALPVALTLVLCACLVQPAASREWRQAASISSYFPIGVFEDGSITNSPSKFEDLIDDLQGRGLDTVLFTNNTLDSADLLTVSDQLGFNVVFAPLGILQDTWWYGGIPATSDAARTAVAPIVDRLAGHSSLRGYNIADEPTADLSAKVAMAIDAFEELDPAMPAIPVLVGLGRANAIFETARPAVMLLDVYPLAQGADECDLRMRAFGYPRLDFVDYLRALTRSKPAQTPLWVILQTHRFSDQGLHALRVPTRAEVRLQQWLAVGEGATGIFWFIYSSQQGWTGLRDNPDLFNEVTRLAERLGPMRETLLALRPTAQRFTVTGSAPAYVSTLESADGSSRYAVLVNRDCSQSRALAVRSPDRSGVLEDVENGQRYALGSAIRVGPGDGRVLRLLTEATQ